MIPRDIETLSGLKLASLKRRWLYGYKWLESCLLVIESILYKRLCQQEGRPRSPQIIDIYTGSLPGIKRKRYRDEVLDTYVRFFWVPWARATFLWTIMSSPPIVDEFQEGADIHCMD
ncbi:hypothetical protein TNCV_4054951 [Trichonephila clavipes]|nr:hypothetical protein TNCV_4054951 [Trichonephila clavipes]